MFIMTLEAEFYLKNIVFFIVFPHRASPNTVMIGIYNFTCQRDGRGITFSTVH